VVVFDRGHLVRNVRAMYGRVVGWYYQGFEPPFFDHRTPLTLEALSAQAEVFREAAARMGEGFRRAPTPARLIEEILE
jgi:hypothetical protein